MIGLMRVLALAGALALACTTATASGTLYIKDSPGGDVDQHEALFKQVARSGQKVIIDGYCNSACTLVAMVPRDRVCVKLGTTLGFHSAYWTADGSYSAEGTRQLAKHYPRSWKRMLLQRGWDSKSPHPDVVNIAGSKLYRVCS